LFGASVVEIVWRNSAVTSGCIRLFSKASGAGPNRRQPYQHQGRKMNRTEILTTANEYITVDRASTHGRAEENFAQIAAVWTWWLNERLTSPISAYDVAMMMSLFKAARAKGNWQNPDNFIDMAGYTALAGEIGCAE
jgi:hypothetical protein